MKKLELCEVRGLLVDLLDKLSGDQGREWLEALKRFLRRENPWHVIDRATDPYIPDGWSIHAEDQLQSAVRASFEWNPDLVELHLDDDQKDGKVIKGTELKKKLEGQRVLTAHVLDYLLSHPHLIPDSWKGKIVLFWGTIYRDSDGDLCVRCLCWDGGRWLWRYDWLDYGFFDVGDPAALLSK